MSEGYDEPFPTGIIQHTNLFKLGSRFYFKQRLHFSAETSYSDIQNYQHIQDENKQNWAFKFGLWLDWDWKFAL